LCVALLDIFWVGSLAVLVSRQFVDMSRIRIEGLLAAFPKLIGSGKQHTYVETENVRYVYQPIEAMYLLLVTNKQSNILEDLDTLRLLSKLVSFFHLPMFFSSFMFLKWDIKMFYALHWMLRSWVGSWLPPFFHMLVLMFAMFLYLFYV
jgi:hypothetical protein